MDRFDAMRAFVRVVEAGSFTKAADTLHMSRTTVTQLVQQLEARLRVRLLNRTTRRVNVTVDGAAYYERAASLLAELDDMESGLPGADTAPRGQLRVDVPSPFAAMILVPALPASTNAIRTSSWTWAPATARSTSLARTSTAWSAAASSPTSR
jgi:DNA-binding transcriptional LysR family regulator